MAIQQIYVGLRSGVQFVHVKKEEEPNLVRGSPADLDEEVELISENNIEI